MQTELIKVKATLVRASKLDLFSNDEVPKVNKILFYKDPTKLKFTGHYRIYETDSHSTNELYQALQLGCLYVLTAKHSENDFCFKLILRLADEFDFFDSPKWIKRNVVYYEIQSNSTVIGPLIIDQFTNADRIKKLISEGMLYVPGQQIFEPFNIKKAA
jgi:hypothetical protein